METCDFSQPQRQSIKGIAIMFADTLQGIIRGLWAPLLLVLYKMDWTKIFVVFGFLVLVLVVIGVIAYLKYINFTFYLDSKRQEFVIQEGIFSKNKVTLQLNKIQQVNINQSLIQKMVGVYSLDIDTAGSTKKEVSIRAIDFKMANYLKELLVASEKTKTNEVATDFAEDSILKINLLTLIKVGFTSNYGRSIALIIGFFGTMYNGIYDFKETFEVDEQEVEGYIDQSIAYFSLSFIILLILFVVITLNVGRIVFKYFDYQIKKQNESLVVSHGLIAKKNTLLKPIKVQSALFSQNFFQKKLNLFTMELNQASSNDGFEQENTKKGTIEIPGCSDAERNNIMTMIYGKMTKEKEVLTPNFRYLLKAVILTIVVPIAAVLILGLFVLPEIQFYFPLILVYLVFVGTVLWFKFRNYRMYVNADFIELKRNAWEVQHQFLEVYKIQGITTKQYFWHKKADVAHITFHTAAGDVGFKFAKYSKLKNWINYWLVEVERSSKKWM
ncbi:PH domain-containing protein [Flavobacterium sp. UBA6135]|uniref:PH domain-containing protein n=1 Tax=Flavobacterium sp. UBA6135 TaxID=1946553 RepID=UPI0025BD0DDE|nr:PH domain-containing protein [Flavobacterium sp. UBA6135]